MSKIKSRNISTKSPKVSQPERMPLKSNDNFEKAVCELLGYGLIGMAIFRLIIGW